MTDIRQSPLYTQYMECIGWKVAKVGKWYAYIKQFPLIGSIIKIQRIKPPIPFEEIESLARKYRAFRTVVELASIHLPRVRWKYGYRMGTAPYSPSKTIYIDLTPLEDEIFQRFKEAKRRGIRRAIKNCIVVKESDDIDQFICLKRKQDFIFGLLIKKDLRALWQNFGPKNISLLLAYRRDRQELRMGNKGKGNDSSAKPHDSCFMLHNSRKSNTIDSISTPIAGVLLLFYNGVAYYWQAAATKEGKSLFAPTLLVWEALKLAKKKGCKTFDFEGVYDERFPKATKGWQGFSQFKNGFGGKTVVYQKPLVKTVFNNL